MLHHLFTTWFEIVQQWGYAGVFFLMALESSIFPVPSEIVMPPAAFWASQGKMNFWLVVLAGTFGSYAGSIISYAAGRWLGAPFIERYGKYFFLSEEKLLIAKAWIRKYGSFGIFISRLLPVVRHLISIPAGMLKMNVSYFSLATLIGAFFWCTVLSWFGSAIIGDHPDLLTSPEALVAMCKQKLSWFVGAVIGLVTSYVVYLMLKNRLSIKGRKSLI